MPSYRCTYLVFDKDKNVNRKCKRSKYFKELCCSHSKIVYNDVVSLIQARFIGNKIRSKIKNILVKLPDDIQRIIINKIRQDYYYRNYHKILNKIIYKKVVDDFYYAGYIYTILDYGEYNMYRDLNEIFHDNLIDFSKYVSKLVLIYQLLNKYFEILNINTFIYKKLNILSRGIRYADFPELCDEMYKYEDKYFSKKNNIL